MGIDVAGLEDREDMVYLFGLNDMALSSDDLQVWAKSLVSAFDEAQPVIISGDFGEVDKTAFYSELSTDEWRAIVDNHSEEPEVDPEMPSIEEIIDMDLDPSKPADPRLDTPWGDTEIEKQSWTVKPGGTVEIETTVTDSTRSATLPDGFEAAVQDRESFKKSIEEHMEEMRDSTYSPLWKQEDDDGED